MITSLEGMNRSSVGGSLSKGGYISSLGIATLS